MNEEVGRLNIRDLVDGRTVDSAILPSASLGWRSLIGLGLSLTAAGIYGPWGFGLAAAGWKGMLLAFAIVTIFYYCLMQCLSELAAGIPSAGAGQAFATEAFGPMAGFTAGAAALVQYVTGAAALAVLFSAYVHPLLGLDVNLTAIVLFALVTFVLIIGVGETILAALILAAFAIAGGVLFGSQMAVASGGTLSRIASSTLHFSGVWRALPFAVPFFIGIEGVPFASEECRNPSKDLPIGLFVSLVTVALLGLVVLVAGPAGAGVDVFIRASDPIVEGLASPRIGARFVLMAVNLAALAGLGSSFFSCLYACSRQAFAMARAGELPAPLAKLNRRGAPAVALVITGAAGLALALSGAIDQLIIIMVFSSFVSYGLMIGSFAKLRNAQPARQRPYRAPAGTLTATIGMSLWFLIFSACLASDLTWSSLGTAMMLCLVGYRVLSGRRRRAAHSL